MSLILPTIALALLYWLFSGQFSASEAIAMVIPLAAAVGLTVAISRVAARRFEYRAPWARLVMRTAISICTDSFKVGVFLATLLVRRPPSPAGSLMRQPFHCGDNSPREAARRALVTLAISASPDRYVIDVSPELGLLGHSLVGSAGNPDPDWPV